MALSTGPLIFSRVKPPLEKKMPKQPTRYQWLVAQRDYSSDDCLLWPFTANCDGYGTFGYRGKGYYAHRFMCELVYGPAPSPAHHAAHTCGSGASGCVNPRHIAWKTASENMHDRTAHGAGAIGKRAKVPADVARQIKELRGVKTQREIAEMFGVSRSNVGCIQRGKTWHNPTKGARRTKNGKRFWSGINIGGRDTYLGTFDTAEEASAAYHAALAKIGQV
jgi:predicted XRE-type DNA-binding protein